MLIVLAKKSPDYIKKPLLFLIIMQSYNLWVIFSIIYNLRVIREFHAINFEADTNVKKNQSNSQQSQYIY